MYVYNANWSLARNLVRNMFSSTVTMSGQDLSASSSNQMDLWIGLVTSRIA